MRSRFRNSVGLLALLLPLTAQAATVSLSGIVEDENGKRLINAAVALHIGDPLVAFVRTTTDAEGRFTLAAANAPELEPGTALRPGKTHAFTPWTVQIPRNGTLQLTASNLNGRVVAALALDAQAGAARLQNAAGMLQGQPAGLYAIHARQGSYQHAFGLQYHAGQATSMGSPALIVSHSEPVLARRTASGAAVRLHLRKAGYQSTILDISSYETDLGTIILSRDPLEDRIDSVLALMSRSQKLAQMTQPASAAGYYSSSYGLYGSTLDGGGSVNTSFLDDMLSGLSSWTSGPRIPALYGKDAVHGHAGMNGATVFPHNIGLGATRDSALVRRIGEATAKEMWATGVDLNFAPSISVPRDERWGRTYEGFGETPELAVQMGAALVRGLQGDHYDAPWRVVATAKHFVADGGTDKGVDRGNSNLTDTELRTIHLPGYEAAVNQGVLSVMVSFNQINGTHQHVDSARITGILKTELGFDGYVISDWNGIANSNSPGYTDNYNSPGYGPSLTQEAVRKAINAGVDLAMEPDYPGSFLLHLNTLVQNGSISEERINDAVRRILRAKFRAGRMDVFAGPGEYRNITSWLGHADHQDLAREAVRKSLVVLKNESDLLPLARTTKIYLTGSHANNIGYQCGGWTLDWQGVNGNYSFSKGTSIRAGIQTVAPAALVSSADDADIILYATGEAPYAEWYGDNSALSLPLHTDANQLAIWKNAGRKIVTILISGRPLPLTQLIQTSDAFVAAWLPGTAGIGIADILFGDYAPTGKLPHTWPADLSDIPINQGDGKESLYPYGHGLSW